MNTTPMLISVAGEKPLPKYYVYYDEWSGEIINIANKYKVCLLYTSDAADE